MKKIKSKKKPIDPIRREVYRRRSFDKNAILVARFEENTKDLRLRLIHQKMEEKKQEKEKLNSLGVTFNTLKNIQDNYRQIQIPSLGEIFNFNIIEKKKAVVDFDRNIKEKRKISQLKEKSLADMNVAKTLLYNNVQRPTGFHLKKLLNKTSNSPNMSPKNKYKPKGTYRSKSEVDLDTLIKKEEMNQYLKKELISPKKIELLDEFDKFEFSAKNFYNKKITKYKTAFFKNILKNIQSKINCHINLRQAKFNLKAMRAKSTKNITTTMNATSYTTGTKWFNSTNTNFYQTLNKNKSAKDLSILGCILSPLQKNPLKENNLKEPQSMGNKHNIKLLKIKKTNQSQADEEKRKEEIKKENDIIQYKRNQRIVNRMLNNIKNLDKEIEDEKEAFKKRNFMSDEDIDKIMNFKKEMKFTGIKTNFLASGGKLGLKLNTGPKINKKEIFKDKLAENLKNLDSEYYRTFNVKGYDLMKDMEYVMDLLKDKKDH